MYASDSGRRKIEMALLYPKPPPLATEPNNFLHAEKLPKNLRLWIILQLAADQTAARILEMYNSSLIIKM